MLSPRANVAPARRSFQIQEGSAGLSPESPNRGRCLDESGEHLLIHAAPGQASRPVTRKPSPREASSRPARRGASARVAQPTPDRAGWLPARRGEAGRGSPSPGRRDVPPGSSRPSRHLLPRGATGPRAWPARPAARKRSMRPASAPGSDRTRTPRSRKGGDPRVLLIDGRREPGLARGFGREDPPLRTDPQASVHDDPAMREDGTVQVGTSVQCRVVRQDGPGSDENGIALLAKAHPIGSSLLSGDPPALCSSQSRSSRRASRPT